MEVTSRARSVPSRYHAKKKTPATFAHRNGDPNTEARDPRSRSRSPTPRSRKGRKGKGIPEKCSPGATRFEGRRRNRTISCDDPNLLTSCPNSSSTAILLISPQLQFPPLFLSGRASSAGPSEMSSLSTGKRGGRRCRFTFLSSLHRSEIPSSFEDKHPTCARAPFF